MYLVGFFTNKDIITSDSKIKSLYYLKYGELIRILITLQFFGSIILADVN